MKTLKVFLISVLSLAILLSITGCVIIPLHKNYNLDSEEVASVEIYDLRNSETHYSNFLEAESPVYTVKKDKTADFLSDLSEIDFSDALIITIAAVDPSFEYGDWVVRINYADESFSLISCNGYGESYDSNGETADDNHFGCDNDEWNQFIGKYVPEDIFEDQVTD